MLWIIKKDGTFEKYNDSKIISAIKKSANRVMYEFTKEELSSICENVYSE
ncbi:MAG: hypothetical protein K2F59_04820, partial [Eubacteriales bacterium]|nr:hypothetical protein [Eubacteriales bacterium]